MTRLRAVDVDPVLVGARDDVAIPTALVAWFVDATRAAEQRAADDQRIWAREQNHNTH